MRRLLLPCLAFTDFPVIVRHELALKWRTRDRHSLACEVDHEACKEEHMSVSEDAGAQWRGVRQPEWPYEVADF